MDRGIFTDSSAALPMITLRKHEDGYIASCYIHNRKWEEVATSEVAAIGKMHASHQNIFGTIKWVEEVE